MMKRRFLFVMFLLWCRHSVLADDSIIYGMNAYDGNVDILEINLTQKTDFIIDASLFGTQACDQDPLTGRLYYSEYYELGADRFAYWDPATGENTLVATWYPEDEYEYYFKHMNFSPEGVLYALTNDDALYTINHLTGELTYLGPVTGLETGEYNRTGDFTFAPDGTLYAVTYDSVYSIDTSTLVATLLQTDLISSELVFTGAAFCGGTLYATTVNPDTGETHVITIDPDTGATADYMTLSKWVHDISSCSAITDPPVEYEHTVYITGGKCFGCK